MEEFGEKTFKSRDELVAAVKEHFRKQNYFVTNKKSSNHRRKAIKFRLVIPTVFVLDCTYKTNRLPLLNIVGIHSTNQTFNAGFAFIKEGNLDEYESALNAFKALIGIEPRYRVLNNQSKK